MCVGVCMWVCMGVDVYVGKTVGSVVWVWIDRCGRVCVDQGLTWVSSSITLPPFFLNQGISLNLEFIYCLDWLVSEPQDLLSPPSSLVHVTIAEFLNGCLGSELRFALPNELLPGYQIKYLELIFAMLCPGMNKIWIQFYGEFSHCLTIPHGWKLYKAVIFGETISIYLSILMSPWKAAPASLGTDMLS